MEARQPSSQSTRNGSAAGRSCMRVVVRPARTARRSNGRKKPGFDCELTAGVSRAVPIPVIASGGAGSLEHFAQVFQEGCADAALAASIFHFSEHAVRDLKLLLHDRGIPVRL